MKSWKTTLCGAIAALGVYFQTIPDPAWMMTLGQVLAGVGTFLTGMFARDNNVTSEQAGLKRP